MADVALSDLLSPVEADRVEALMTRSAVREYWFQIVLAFFYCGALGLSPLLWDRDPTPHFYNLSFRMVAVGGSAAIFLALLIRLRRRPALSRRATNRRALAADLAFHLGWGLGVTAEFLASGFDLGFIIVLQLIVTGMLTAFTGPKLDHHPVAPRLVMFAPMMITLATFQPPMWFGLLGLGMVGFLLTAGAGEIARRRSRRQMTLRVRIETAHARLEEEARLRGRLIHALSHDLGQPLGAMSHYVRHFEGDRDARDQTASKGLRACTSALEEIVQSAAQAAWLGGGRPTLNPERISVGDALMRIGTELLAQADQRGLTLRRRPSDLFVQADRLYLERALRNLAHNAIKFTPAGGGVLLAAQRRGPRVRICVIDDGPGVAPEDQQRIFDAFTQGRLTQSGEHGVGLGLSVARDLCRAMGGDLTFRTRPGRGSSFRVELPEAPA